MFRILVISSSFPAGPHDIRGIFISKLVRGMQKQGYQMFVLTPHIPGSSFFEIEEGITVIRFPYFYPLRLQRLCGTEGMYFGFKNSIFGKLQLIPYLLMMIILSGICIKKFRISLIHTHWIVPQGIAGAIWHIISGIPHVTTSHVLDVTITRIYPSVAFLIRQVLYHSDHITTNSSFTQNQVLPYLNYPIPITIVPMGIDDDQIVFRNFYRNPDTKTKRILFVGRLIEWKGAHTLISAVQKIHTDNPEISLDIIGIGPCMEKYKTMVIESGLSDIIRFRGRVSDQDLRSAYRSADLFVLPSQENNNIVMEGLGVVLLEAMASGIPVIGSNTGGIPDIIKDGVNGLLVPPGDADALAQAIIQILKNPEVSEKFQSAGAQTVRDKFSWRIITDRFVDVYEETLNTKTI